MPVTNYQVMMFNIREVRMSHRNDNRSVGLLLAFKGLKIN